MCRFALHEYNRENKFKIQLLMSLKSNREIWTFDWKKICPFINYVDVTDNASLSSCWKQWVLLHSGQNWPSSEPNLTRIWKSALTHVIERTHVASLPRALCSKKRKAKGPWPFDIFCLVEDEKREMSGSSCLWRCRLLITSNTNSLSW